MSILSVIRRIFNRTGTAPLDPRRGQAWWLATPYIPDGLSLTLHQVFEVSAVWSCCNLIANSIAAAPWYVLNVDPRTGRRTKTENDSLAYLLNVQPNPETVAQSFKEALVFQALIYGNSYAEIETDGAARVIGLWPLLSERMLPLTRDASGALVYDYINPSGLQARLRGAEVFHLRGPSLDGLIGQGIVFAAAKAVATAAAADRYTSSYYANAATPSGVLSTPKTLQPADRAALKLEFSQKYASHRNTGKPLVLDGGLEWKAVSHNPEEAQLVQGRQFSVEEIARYFGVPLHFLASPQGSQGYGRNLSELGHALINYGLTPWTKRLEQETQGKLVSPRSNKVTVIDLSYLSRGTEKEMAEADEIRIRSGVATINEVRESLGKNHGPAELDRHFVLTTLQPIEKALAPTPPPASQPTPPAGTDPEQDPGGLQIGTESPVARAAVDLLTRALTDHARRWRARRKDLERNVKADEIDAQLAVAQQELRAMVGAEFRIACEAVEAGVEPRKAAAYHFRADSLPTAADLSPTGGRIAT